MTCQVNTLGKGASEVLIYFWDNSKDFIGVFDPNKASELPNLSSVEYSINIDNMVLYRPLYNLSET
jgi:hypothetical protein